MSRAGKPTDNPTDESLNGWIKEEMIVDFRLYEEAVDRGGFVSFVGRYVSYFNGKRPCYSLGYRTPDGFHRDFVEGRIERKDAFAHRKLDLTPKFIRERPSISGNGECGK